MKMRVLAIWFVLIMSYPALPAFAGEAPAIPRECQNLTLEQAFAIAEDLQPELAEAKAHVRSAEARAQQAGAFPNPEAVLGAQQIPLDNDSAEEREYVAGISQPIPLGRRLQAGREAALLDREVQARGLEVKRRVLRKHVHSAFATALYQEKAVATRKQLLDASERGANSARARVEAGDAVAGDLARVEMDLARARLELQRAESMRGESMVTLAAALGDSSITVKSVAGTLDTAFEVPALENLVQNISSLPETALAEADLRASESRVLLAESERIPDIKVEVLYHRLDAINANTLDVGVNIPLPLFHRNGGRVREAQAEMAAAEARARMTRSELLRRIREVQSELTTALAATRTLKAEIMPRADTVLKAAEARYRAGDISLAEVLPVRREWVETQLACLESVRDLMQAWSELKSLLPPH